MPQLGTGNPNTSGNGIAAAYPNDRRFSLYRMLFAFVFFFVIRNAFVHDYRNEGKSYLRSAGWSDEKIDKYIPQSRSEIEKKRETELDEFKQLKTDVEMLRKEVEELREKIEGNDITNASSAKA
mmetsp:Transcript_37010/g.56873  ORF Transcript_37010/g.56873 Transcript_37010/m.56873 type:complete len:124 (-) Transcript_37010:78-449(-)